jgi:hypothetical protein
MKNSTQYASELNSMSSSNQGIFGCLKMSRALFKISIVEIFPLPESLLVLLEDLILN